MSVSVLSGDCLEILPTLADASIDACVTDPPYHLTSIVKRYGRDNAAPARVGKSGAYNRCAKGFMGKTWDGGDIAFRPDVWREVIRVLKPGAHLVGFGGTRTCHRMVCAIEDAGFEIRDTLCWMYGTGFPKSLDVSKAIDKAAGAKREVVGIKPGHEEFAHRTTRGHIEFKNATDGFDRPWMNDDEARARYHQMTAPATEAARKWQGWGTALKPAFEPIVLARKPLIGTVAANVLAWGTGALNVDRCRIETDQAEQEMMRARSGGVMDAEIGNNIFGKGYKRQPAGHEVGRWPANVVHDGSEEVVGMFPEGANSFRTSRNHQGGEFNWKAGNTPGFDDSGSAARFFYTAKADKQDRLSSKHPTVKPIDLMAYLCRLVTPPGGTVLDPFAGSGSTGMACMREGFDCVLVEREAEYVADIRRRIAHVSGQDAPLFAGAAE